MNKNNENKLNSEKEFEYQEKFNEIFKIEIESLILAQSKIGVHYFKAAKMISEANKVILSGIGKSGLIAKKIAATLSSYNISAAFLHPVEALHGDIGIIQPKDVVILLSKSGSTEEITRLVPFIKSRTAQIISIVSNTNSYLAYNSDVVLEAAITREACPFNIAPTSSTTSTIVIGDAISIVSALLKNFKLEDFSKTHPLGTIGKQINLQVKDIMHKGNNLPVLFESSTFKDAIIKISEKGLGCVVIINEEYELKGLITDGDVRRALQKYNEINNLTTHDIMTKNPISINENEYLDVALALMESRESQISLLVVVDESNKVVGVIRLHDIIRSGL
ncbi:MAG: KpsF/GutQ family sugar-phosphate isomerase [Candidatus Kapaibacteriota bacterium]